MINNYKGIESVSLDGIADQSTVMVSGRNGTGKSLLLEAIAFAWHGRIAMQDKIGPFADSCSIELTVRLTENEAQVVQNEARRSGRQELTNPNFATLSRAATRLSEGPSTNDQTVDILRSPIFRREHPFAEVDYLPAHRTLNMSPDGTGAVDLGMFYHERIDQERENNVQSTVNYRTAFNLPDVSSYLLTLDYQNFVASRQGIDLSNEYGLIADTFKSATGKILRLPEYDMAQGNSRIWVELPTGKRHLLSALSSGEQEMLGLMYYMRRLSATGGVLCIDEPELHLHPTLQAAVFSSMRDLSERAQVFVVSHSPSLISTAPASALIQVAAPNGHSGNQARRLEDETNRRDLISILGVTPANLVQNDLILAVEGQRDREILTGLFPVELGRSLVLTPGDRQRVLQRYDSLYAMPPEIPWFCVIDRDLLSDDEVQAEQIARPGLFVWSRRAIESCFLDARLLAAVLNSSSLGVQIDDATASRILWEAAEPLMDEVLAGVVNRRLMSEIPPPTPSAGLGRFEQIRQYQTDYAEISKRRALIVGQLVSDERRKLESRWAEDWPLLVEPKAVWARVHAKVGHFRTANLLLNSIIAYARDNPSYRPRPIQDFSDRISLALQAH